MEQDQITSAVDWLVDDWCEVRKLKALRYVLAAYPLEGTTVQDWARLRDALTKVLSTCAAELGDAERETVKGLVASLDRVAPR
jgi:hypothetical protein